MAGCGSPISGQLIDQWLQRQKVCVTGGQGALGRRLVKRLSMGSPQKIVVLDKQSYSPFRKVSRAAPVEYVMGDILRSEDVEHALKDCTVLFHLAALVHVGDSEKQPVEYFKVNALGTINVLEACRRLGVQKVFYTSTGHVYGVPHQLPVTEEHPTFPISVYAASKLAGEIAIQGYAASYGISCSIARLSNLYGASLNGETAVGSALIQVFAGKRVCLRNLAAIRDFIHVDDVVEALLRLAAIGDGWKGCRIVNISTGKEISIGEMAQTLAKVAAEQGLGWPEIVQTSSEQNEPVPKLILDNGRLRDLTHWTPQIDLEQGLRLAMEELQQQKNTLR